MAQSPTSWLVVSRTQADLLCWPQLLRQSVHDDCLASSTIAARRMQRIFSCVGGVAFCPLTLFRSDRSDHGSGTATSSPIFKGRRMPDDVVHYAVAKTTEVLN